jgi:hypothetical protein
MMIKTAMALTTLLATASFSHAAPSCQIPPFKMIQDVTVTGAMYVTSGKGCGVAVANSAGGVQSHEITRNPSNGKVEIDGFIVRYTSRSGFVGKDSFSFIRHVLDHRTNRPMALPVDMDVTVTAQ